MDVHEPYVPEKKYVEMVYPEITLSREAMFGLFKEHILKQDASNPEKVYLLRQLYEIHVREVDTYVDAVWCPGTGF
jgi:hypothetical protein